MKAFEVKLGTKTYIYHSKSEHALKKRLGKTIWRLGATIKEMK